MSACVSDSMRWEPPSGSVTLAAPELESQHLLRAQRDLGRLFGGQGQRFVVAVGVQ